MGLQATFLARELVFACDGLVAYLSERGVARPGWRSGLWLGRWLNQTWYGSERGLRLFRAFPLA